METFTLIHKKVDMETWILTSRSKFKFDAIIIVKFVVHCTFQPDYSAMRHALCEEPEATKAGG